MPAQAVIVLAVVVLQEVGVPRMVLAVVILQEVGVPGMVLAVVTKPCIVVAELTEVATTCHVLENIKIVLCRKYRRKT